MTTLGAFLGVLILSAAPQSAPPFAGDGAPPGPRAGPVVAEHSTDVDSPAARATPGNILLIVADDLGVDLIGAYGEGLDLPPTPNIDGLAASGVLFRNAWSDPVCSPTRATLQTGRFGFRTRIGFATDFTAIEPGVEALSQSELTLPEMLDFFTGGLYAHAAFGKWHLGTNGVGDLLAPNQAGYSHYAGIIANFPSGEDYYNWTRVVDGVAATETGYATTVNVDDALAWIASAPEPWFCYLAFNAPHAPFQAPPPALHTVDVSSGTARVYAKAMVEAMDTEIGRLLAGVPATTSVIFLGDNGTSPGVIFPPFSPDKAKGTLFEGGINVPLIVCSPAVNTPGSESQALVNTTDIFATVAELAGGDLTIPLPLIPEDSVSLVPYLRNPTKPSIREFAFAEMFIPNGFVVEPWPPPCQGVRPPRLCQQDLGFAGPGSATLTVCGDPLYGGHTAQLALSGAPANADAWILVSDVSNPTPMFGGTLVPVPSTGIQQVQTDALGQHTSVVVGGLGEGPLFMQMYVEDRVQTEGFTISNAVRVQSHRTNLKAIRNDRYKLIVNVYSCDEMLFDLDLDPFEDTDLLDGTLTPEEQTAYTELRDQLDDLLRLPNGFQAFYGRK